MFRPYPKPEKKAKAKATKIKNVSNKRVHICSNGEVISQQQINDRLKKAYQAKAQNATMICAGCGQSLADDNDHTISQKRCKQLHKTELIYDPENFEHSCRQCHVEWEQYKSGYFEEHNNAVKRMKYLKEHDTESFNKRIAYVSKSNILNIK